MALSGPISFFVLTFLFNVTTQSSADYAHAQSTQNTKQKDKTENYQPTLIELADEYSVNNKAVGIIVSKGKKDEGGLTGLQIGGMIKNYFDGEGITSKPFVGLSTADYTTIGYMVKSILYGPVSLGEAKSMAVVAASGYDDAYGTHLTRKPAPR